MRSRSGWWAAAVGAVVLVAFVVAACWPQALAPVGPTEIDPAAAFQGPSWGHWFGTDESGRDVFSRVVYGAADSLTIGLWASVIGLALGTLLALPAVLPGRVGAVLDGLAGRAIETLFAFPTLMVALLYVALAGPGVRSAVVSVGLATAPGYARAIRSTLTHVNASGFVRVARASGHSRWYVATRHVLPHTALPLLPLLTVGVGQAVVWASSLSFLGIGVQPPAPEWGAMLNAGRPYLLTAWWLSVFPGCAVVAFVLACGAVGRAWQRSSRGWAA